MTSPIPNLITDLEKLDGPQPLPRYIVRNGVACAIWWRPTPLRALEQKEAGDG